MRVLSKKEIRDFRRIVYGYFDVYGRDLPWRHTLTPYRIFVSEVMLQQTQVERVKEKFPLFIKTFPSFRALARAGLVEVYNVWRGMGYNRRALFLKKAAEVIISTYKGKFPRVPEMLEQLPGIGKATASSIAVFAFNYPAVFIETNVRSVILHHFFNGKINVRDEEVRAIAAQVLDTTDARGWYSAMMDYGTYLKKNIPNPSRTSVHHIQQKPFEGSVRQARGAVLKALGSAALSRGDLKKLLSSMGERVPIALEQLRSEGLIVARSGRFFIPR